MRPPLTKLTALVLILSSACTPIVSEPSRMVVPTSTALPTKTPLPTSTPSSASAPVPTPLVLSDPRIRELENSGYKRSKLSQYVVKADTGSTTFSGPDDSQPVPQLRQGDLSYLQYIREDKNNCVLVFTVLDSGQNRVISMIDASKINQRLMKTTSDPIGLLSCSPYGWGDINQNGKPDMAVGFVWANQYVGSELHIFEVNNDLSVTNLTVDLPGIISPDYFDPSTTRQMVIDVAWAYHDCIYPPILIYWLYDWRDGKYVDITPEVDLSSNLGEQKRLIMADFGQPFNGVSNIELLTELLIMYDKIGQREQGWQEYLHLTDLANWPGTDDKNAAWLKSDVEHFQKQYNSNQPFTPNKYPCWTWN